MNIRQIICTVLVLGSGLHALSAEVPRKVVGQKQVDISYRVSENLTGIKSVELWTTTDGGRTWQMWARDDDTVPPVSFRAAQDGEYGIIIISTDKAGNREATPTPGTKPEAILIVDTTAPAVRIRFSGWLLMPTLATRALTYRCPLTAARPGATRPRPSPIPAAR